MQNYHSRLEIFSLHLKEPHHVPVKQSTQGMERIKEIHKGPMEKCLNEKEACEEKLNYKKKFLKKYGKALENSEKLFREMQEQWEEQENQQWREEQTQIDEKVLREQKAFIEKLKSDIASLELRLAELNSKLQAEKKVVMERIETKKRASLAKEIRSKMENVKKQARQKKISRESAKLKLNALEEAMKQI